MCTQAKVLKKRKKFISSDVYIIFLIGNTLKPGFHMIVRMATIVATAIVAIIAIIWKTLLRSLRKDRKDRKSGFHMIVAIIWKPGLIYKFLEDCFDGFKSSQNPIEIQPTFL